MASVPIKITNSGVVGWLAPANFEAYCELNIKYYPFDKQTCSMEVSKIFISIGFDKIMYKCECFLTYKPGHVIFNNVAFWHE